MRENDKRRKAEDKRKKADEKRLHRREKGTQVDAPMDDSDAGEGSADADSVESGV